MALLAVAEGQSYEAAAGRAGFAHGTAVSRDTVQRTLQRAGSSWQRTRSWCPTGTARRRTVTVTDPAAERKKG